jgi:TPP-dependent pyruvate/acetoin dehydrogenase alpha subunit
MKTKNKLSILHRMLLIRAFEEKVADLAKRGLAKCPVHLYTGQEAIAASVLECASPGIVL